MATSTEMKAARGTDEFLEIVDRRRKARMDKIDAMQPAVRELVNDYGLNVVVAFLDIGIKEARHIRHLVETVLNEFSPTRGSSSAQGVRADIGSRAPQRS